MAILKIKKNNVPKTDLSASLMLVDYYQSSKSTLFGDGHYELVLSSAENSSKAILDKYIKEDEDSNEIKTSYTVPYRAVEECMAIINREELHKWNTIDNAINLEGEIIVCKFWDGNRHIRVSTDNMPENGLEVFYEIRNTISKYLP